MKIIKHLAIGVVKAVGNGVFMSLGLRVTALALRYRRDLRRGKGKTR